MIDYLRDLLGWYPTFGGVGRSGSWPRIQKEFLKNNPHCAVCGCKSKLLSPLNVHHCRPYHLHPELELDPTNLITLCRAHHLLVGHLMSWSSYNTDVRDDARMLAEKIRIRP